MVGLVGGSTVRAEHVVANAGGETEYVRRLHRHAPAEHQCTSTLVKHIKAPVHLVSTFLSTSFFSSVLLNQIVSISAIAAAMLFLRAVLFPCSMASRLLLCCPVDPPQRHRFDRFLDFSFLFGPARFWSADAPLLD